MSGPTRREFLGQLVWIVSIAVGAGRALTAWGAPKADNSLPAGKTAAKTSDPVAEQLGYQPDAKKVDGKKYPQRKKPEAQNQFCEGCMFYTPENASWGKCQLIQSGLVNAKGWCISWAKKS